MCERGRSTAGSSAASEPATSGTVCWRRTARSGTKAERWSPSPVSWPRLERSGGTLTEPSRRRTRMGFKKERLGPRLVAAARSGERYRDAHMFLGGTGAVGGTALLQLLSLYEEMFAIEPPE